MKLSLVYKEDFHFDDDENYIGILTYYNPQSMYVLYMNDNEYSLRIKVEGEIINLRKNNIIKILHDDFGVQKMFDQLIEKKEMVCPKCNITMDYDESIKYCRKCGAEIKTNIKGVYQPRLNR